MLQKTYTFSATFLKDCRLICNGNNDSAGLFALRGSILAGSISKGDNLMSLVDE
jgi:hypothetical protein